MITILDADFIGVCVEWFLYGLYSGIFAIYLQCPKKESRSAMIVFYVLCLLYVLSTASVVFDLSIFIFGIYINGASALSPQIQIDMRSMIIRLYFVQITLIGCCDVIAQFILIYRCWIVWGKNICIAIIPSFLAITYLATWITEEVPVKMLPGTLKLITTTWGNTLSLTAFATTMSVNTLVTGLIVFKILKVFLEVKPTSVERTMGSLSSTTGNPKLQHIIFIIIESGIALFAIHLVRILVISLGLLAANTSGVVLLSNLVAVFYEMLNGIAPTIILVRVSMGLSFDDEESLKEGVGSLNFYNPPSDPNTPALLSSGSIPLQERNDLEDICFNNSPSDDPNSLRRVGSCSSSSNIPDQERIEVI